MAFSKPLLLALVFSFAVLNLLESHSAIAAASREGPSHAPAPSHINCEGACIYRCSQSWKSKMCMKMCLVCCDKCGCVPRGPKAPRDSACACYTNLKNPKKGTYKCPINPQMFLNCSKD